VQADPQTQNGPTEITVTTSDAEVAKQQAIFDSLNAPQENQPFELSEDSA
jgi:hypothetical protein